MNAVANSEMLLVIYVVYLSVLWSMRWIIYGSAVIYVAVSPFISQYLLKFLGHGPWKETYVGDSLVWGSLRLTPTTKTSLVAQDMTRVPCAWKTWMFAIHYWMKITSKGNSTHQGCPSNWTGLINFWTKDLLTWWLEPTDDPCIVSTHSWTGKGIGNP